MRLGEFRTYTRDLENKYMLKVAIYDEKYGVTIYDLETDMINGSDEIYFRLVEEEK